MIDEIYTPAGLAAELVELANLTSPSFIADFAAGEGSLLKAAKSVWPSAGLVGSDLNPASVATLQSHWPEGVFEVGDFLSTSLHETSNLRSLKAVGADLILLNPPFSCRPGDVRQVQIDKELIGTSTALAFIAKALEYLSNEGELVAVVPDSLLSSERDSHLLNVLMQKHVVTDHGLASDGSFGRFNVRVRKIVVRKSAAGALIPTRESADANKLPTPIAVSLKRGGLACHSQVFAEGTVPFVHSTDLQQHALLNPLRTVKEKRSLIRAPAVLIPRVGKASLHKLVLVEHGVFALSDCVIGLICSTADDAKILHQHLIQDWPHLRDLYRGTCAPYLRMAELRRYLVARNIWVGSDEVSVEAKAA